MRYQDGRPIKVGDCVGMPDGLSGKVLVVIDFRKSTNVPINPEWGNLKAGILVKTPDAGVVHYGREHNFTAIKHT